MSKWMKNYVEYTKRIVLFCKLNGITYSTSLDSFYFSLNGKDYRISNHSLEDSIKFSHGRYHTNKEQNKNLICIQADKSQLFKIYNKLKEGKEI